MIDGSRLTLDDNIALTARVVETARRAGVSVEGEVGVVGYIDGAPSRVTAPREAERFERESGVDALAVSVGNIQLAPADPGARASGRQVQRRRRIAYGFRRGLAGLSGQPSAQLRPHRDPVRDGAGDQDRREGASDRALAPLSGSGHSVSRSMSEHGNAFGWQIALKDRPLLWARHFGRSFHEIKRLGAKSRTIFIWRSTSGRQLWLRHLYIFSLLYRATPMVGLKGGGRGSGWKASLTSQASAPRLLLATPSSCAARPRLRPVTAAPQTALARLRCRN